MLDVADDTVTIGQMKRAEVELFLVIAGKTVNASLSNVRVGRNVRFMNESESQFDIKKKKYRKKLRV